MSENCSGDDMLRVEVGRTLRPSDPPTINPQRNRKMSDSPQLKEATEGGSDAPACSVSSNGPTGTEIARSLGNREVVCAVPLRECPICGRPALLRYTPMHPGKYEVMCEAYWLPDTRACNGEESCPSTHLHAEPAAAAQAWNAGILEFGSPQNAYMHAPGVGEATGWKLDRDCGLHAMPC